MSLRQPKAMRSGSRIAYLLLLFALTWQGLIVQGHAHFVPPARAIAGATTTLSAVTDAASTTPSAPTCFLCEEQALFGAYVLGGPVAVVLPVARVAWYEPIVGLYSAVRQPSHSWRSRAPPSLPHLSTI